MIHIASTYYLFIYHDKIRFCMFHPDLVSKDVVRKQLFIFSFTSILNSKVRCARFSCLYWQIMAEMDYKNLWKFMKIYENKNHCVFVTLKLALYTYKGSESSSTEAAMLHCCVSKLPRIHKANTDSTVSLVFSEFRTVREGEARGTLLFAIDKYGSDPGL